MNTGDSDYDRPRIRTCMRRVCFCTQLRVMHPDPVLLSDMTSAERGAVYRYLARFAELDDAKIFYAYGHAYELARKDAERGLYATMA